MGRTLFLFVLLVHAARAGEVPADRRMEVIQQWQAVGPVPDAALKDACFLDARKVGITSFQSYVHWSEIEPEPGVITFENYDPLVAQLENHGLKWVPFIIAGPYYSTPEWFRDSPGSVYARCLEHDQDNVIQSIWNPALVARVGPFLKTLAEHYRDGGVLESVELGISGNWGESIFPAGGGFAWKDSFHTHMGMWCGDAHAAASFRDWLSAGYAGVAKLNRAWGSGHASLDAISPKLAFSGSEAARRDLMAWYLESMTRYAEHWVASARRHFPDQKIYLCTGGAGEAALGADFAAQAKMCARYGAGLRITNQNDAYADSYPTCRWLSTSCRRYGVYLTTEPAGANSPLGVPMRIFDAMGLGADGLYFKMLLDNRGGGTYLESDLGRVFREYHAVLRRATPKIEVAAYYPQEHFVLNANALRPYHKTCARMRDLVDLDMIDASLILDGALEHYKAVIVLPLAAPGPEAQAALAEWQRKDPARLVVTPEPKRLAESVSQALRDRVWGDWSEDGVYHARTDVGILALNTTAEPVKDVIAGESVGIPPRAMVVLTDRGKKGSHDRTAR